MLELGIEPTLLHPSNQPRMEVFFNVHFVKPCASSFLLPKDMRSLPNGMLLHSLWTMDLGVEQLKLPS